jgi:LuxR family quorum sensing-dependent transcriptional regulator
MRGLHDMGVNTRRNSRAMHSLTAREAEVLHWVARGKSAWEIGEILNIAKRTVDEHVQTAVRKLGAVNRTHAVAMAVRDAIISL